MACERVSIPDGAGGVTTGIICTRGRRSKRRRCATPECLREPRFECDGKLPNGKPCNALICVQHRTNIGPELDHCPACHSRAVLEQQSSPLFPGGKMRLTTEQRDAAHCPEPRLAVVGGPGTGKGEVLVARVCRMLAVGVEPRSILLCAWTMAAAEELRGRLWEEDPSTSARQVQVTTLLGWAYEQAKAHPGVFGLRPGFDVFDLTDGETLKDGLHLMLAGYPAKKGQRHEDVLGMYRQRLHQDNAVDADDLIRLAAEILRGQEAEALKPSCRHVLVDEAQDLEEHHHQLLESMAPASLTLAGDPRQAIYGFRGAQPEVFGRWSRQVTCKWLSVNLRAGRQLVKLGNEVFKGSPFPDQQGARSEEGTVQVRTSSELKAVLWSVRPILESGVPPRQVAVLARTWRELARAADVLKADGIATAYYGADRSPWESATGRTLARWLRLVANPASRTLAMFLLRRLYPDKDISGIPDEAAARQISVSQLAQELGLLPAPLHEEHPTRAHAEQLLACPSLAADAQRASTHWLLEQLDKPARQRLHDFRRWWALTRTPSDLEEFSKPDAVQLMTIHSVKGKQWRAVVLLGIDQESFPGHPKRPTDSRNLLYTAITRARDWLAMVCPEPPARPTYYLPSVGSGDGP